MHAEYLIYNKKDKLYAKEERWHRNTNCDEIFKHGGIKGLDVLDDKKKASKGIFEIRLRATMWLY